ncbi:mechanosensitive ion channel family protein [Flavobacterium sp. JP2137]|uniref:mechanosensitive ion channel family protein n=1 Tax=Flavobacterium sp. JP2137 TaxID=3414510 RepID=UPI003D2FB15E
MEKIQLGLGHIIESILISLPKIAIGLAILVGGSYAIKLILRFVRSRFERRKVDVSLRGFLISLLRIALYIVLIITVASTMGIQTTSFVAIFGAAGLGVGLALQGSLSNLAGGVLILMFKPFKVGDYISNSAGTAGTVERIDILYTSLRTADGISVYSPNGTLANSVISNFTNISQRRFDFTVGISYGANIKEAREIIMEALMNDGRVMATPKPDIFVKELGDSAVDMTVRGWTVPADYWQVVYDIQEKVKVALDQRQIEIPFPQRDLHIIKEEA